jgi:carboxyvinyl-carboxyphosphonate phosphorylmutase
VELLHPAQDGPARLRALLARPEPLLAAGAYDGLSARLVEAAGFDAVYMTGFGTAASLLGRPDVGLLTLTEMVGNAGRIADAVSVPVIADADTGYGNPINVVRTVQAYERAGVAGIHLEDQVAPKKCGHMAGKSVVPVEEHVAKVRAAVAARQNPDFVLIARTDARAVEGLDAAIERARRYADAGADVLFVEAPQSVEEIERVASELAGHSLLFNWAEGGKTPPVDHATLSRLGYRVVIFPVATLLTAARAITATLASMRATGTPIAAIEDGRLMGFGEFLDFIGLPEVYELEQRFS